MFRIRRREEAKSRQASAVAHDYLTDQLSNLRSRFLQTYSYYENPANLFIYILQIVHGERTYTDTLITANLCDDIFAIQPKVGQALGYVAQVYGRFCPKFVQKGADSGDFVFLPKNK